jgi:hypothetical protein
MISGRSRARKILRKIEIQQKPRISAFIFSGALSIQQEFKKNFKREIISPRQVKCEELAKYPQAIYGERPIGPWRNGQPPKCQLAKKHT